MRNINELVNILKQHFVIDKRRLSCLVLMVSSVLQMRTVNMKQLAQKMADKIKPESAYRKLQRLMSELSIDMLYLSAWMLSWFYEKDEKIYLTRIFHTYSIERQLISANTVKVFFFESVFSDYQLLLCLLLGKKSKKCNGYKVYPSILSHFCL